LHHAVYYVFGYLALAPAGLLFLQSIVFYVKCKLSTLQALKSCKCRCERTNKSSLPTFWSTTKKSATLVHFVRFNVKKKAISSARHKLRVEGRKSCVLSERWLQTQTFNFPKNEARLVETTKRLSWRRNASDEPHIPM